MKTPSIITATLFAALATATLAGCPGVEAEDPIINSWESDKPIEGYHNELEIEEDLEGDAVLYFFWSDGYFYSADFKAEAEVTDDGEYEVSMECEGDCAFLDFTMTCELSGDGDELECEGDELWTDYEFNWKVQ